MSAPANNKPPKTPRFRRTKRTAKALLWLVVVVVVLASVALGWLHTEWGKEWAREAVEARLKGAVLGSARLGGLDYALGGSVQASDLALRDDHGRDVLALGEVGASVAWGSLVGSGPVEISSAWVRGLQLNITQNPDRTLNLQTLLRPRPAASSDAKPGRGVVIERVSLSGVGARFDGLSATAALENLSLEGALSTHGGFSAQINTLEIEGLWFTQGPLGVWLRDVRARLSVARGGERLEARLDGLRADGRLQFPGVVGEKAFAVSLEQATFTQDAEGLHATLDGVGVGVVSLAHLDADFPSGVVHTGSPLRLSLEGLTLHADALNRLFDQPLLATDLRAKLLVEGPTSALAVTGEIDTRGGLLSAAGVLDIARIDAPTYDITLTGEQINTALLLDERTQRLPLLEGSLTAHIQGQGVTRDTVDALITAEIGPTRIDGVPVDGVLLRAKLLRGHVSVESLRVLALGQALAVRGGFDPVLRQLHTHLRLAGDAQDVAERCARERLPCPEILTHSAGTFDLTLSGALSLPPLPPPDAKPPNPDQPQSTKILKANGQFKLTGEDISTPHTRLKRLDVDMQGAVSDWDAKRPFGRAVPGLLPKWVLDRLPFQEGILHGSATLTALEVPEARLSVGLGHAVLDVDFTGTQPIGTIEVSGQDLRVGALSVAQFMVRVTLERERLHLRFEASDPAQNLQLLADAEVQIDDEGWVVRLTDLSASAGVLGGLALSLKEPVVFRVPHGLLVSPQVLEVPAVVLSALGGEVTVSGTIKTAPQPNKPPDGAEPAKQNPKIAITDADLTVSFTSLSVGMLAGLGPSSLKLPSFIKKGRLDGVLSVSGLPASPTINANIQARVPNVPLLGGPLKVALQADADLSGVEVRASAHLGKERLLSATASLPLAKNPDGKLTLDSAQSLRVSLDAPDIALGPFAALLPSLPKALNGAFDGAHASLSVTVSGSSKRPRGSVDVQVWGLGAGLPARWGFLATLTPSGGGSTLQADLNATWSDAQETLRARVLVTGARLSEGGGLRLKAWEATADIPRQPLARVKHLVPALKKLSSGDLTLHLDAHGDREDLFATLTASVDGFVREGSALPPLSAGLVATLDEDALAVTLDASLSPKGIAPLTAQVWGRLGVGGDGFLRSTPETLKGASLTVDVEVSARSLADWSAVIQGLAAVKAWPGTLGLRASLSGSVSAPMLDLRANYKDFALQDKRPGLLDVRLLLDDKDLSASLNLGADHAGGEKLTVSASTARGSLDTFQLGEDIPLVLRAQTASGSVPLAEVLPAHLIPDALKLRGLLDANLSGSVNLQIGLLGLFLNTLDLQGHLRLSDGAFALPGSARTLEDISLDLSADADKLLLKSLQAHERDEQNPDRTLNLSGVLHLIGAKPSRATLHLITRDWLAVGKPYAPTASITADATVEVNFTSMPRQITVEVANLNLQNPNRFKFAHAQDFLDRGDVVFLAPGQAPGGLKAAPAPAPFASLLASDLPWSIDLRLPPRAVAYFSPLDLVVSGDLHADITSSGLSVQGEIKALEGEMEFTGTRYKLSQGRVFFDPQSAKGCERGCLDLHFKRPPDPVMQRDMAASAGEMGVSLVGVIGKQDLILRGAGNTDLAEVSAVQNARRARYVSHPDMAASQAVQHPGPDTPLVHTFLRTNMPHLILVDRASAWADPLDSQEAYGQLRHAQVDDYSTDGERRVHIEAHPPAVGRSQVWASYDWLFANSPRWLAGVGLRLGDTAKAGAYVFMRWSSSD